MNDQILPQVVKEMYWIANYIDGTKLSQFENGIENRYIDIDRNKLNRFDLYDKDTHTPVYALYLRDGQRLIFRRRTLKRIGQPDIVVFMVGYQMTIMTGSGPKEYTVINYFHPDGSISLDGPRDNLELLSFEK